MVAGAVVLVLSIDMFYVGDAIASFLTTDVQIYRDSWKHIGSISWCNCTGHDMDSYGIGFDYVRLSSSG